MTKCYEYVSLYTDNCLFISDRAEHVPRNEVTLNLNKPLLVLPLLKYLGGKLCEVELENGQQCLAFGSKQYVESAAQNIIDYHNERAQSLPVKASSPMSYRYCPEIDTTPGLRPADTSYCHSLISVLRWILELGRLDINIEVSMMSSYCAIPRETLRALPCVWLY